KSNRITSAIRRQGFRKVLDVLAPGFLSLRIVVVGSFVYGEFLDLVAQFDGCFQGQASPGRVAVHEGGFSRFVDQRVDVFDLPLDRIGLSVPTDSPAPTVIAVDREVLREKLSELRL